MTAALVTEIVMTMMFLLVIMGATDERAPAGTGATGNRDVPDADPPDQHSRHQYLGQSGKEYRCGAVRGRLGHLPALAVLDRPHHWRRIGRAHLQKPDSGSLTHRLSIPAGIRVQFHRAMEQRAIPLRECLVKIRETGALTPCFIKTCG